MWPETTFQHTHFKVIQLKPVCFKAKCHAHDHLSITGKKCVCWNWQTYLFCQFVVNHLVSHTLPQPRARKALWYLFRDLHHLDYVVTSDKGGLTRNCFKVKRYGIFLFFRRQFKNLDKQIRSTNNICYLFQTL